MNELFPFPLPVEAVFVTPKSVADETVEDFKFLAGSLLVGCLFVAIGPICFDIFFCHDGRKL